MANPENLRTPSTSEAREMQLKSAAKRSQNIKEKKLIRERILERMSETDWDECIDNFIDRAKKGDRAFELMRDTIGEKPVEQVNITNVDKSLEEMEAFFNKQHE